jgi:hypothetical protein
VKVSAFSPYSVWRTVCAARNAVAFAAAGAAAHASTARFNATPSTTWNTP